MLPAGLFNFYELLKIYNIIPLFLNAIFMVSISSSEQEFIFPRVLCLHIYYKILTILQNISMLRRIVVGRSVNNYSGLASGMLNFLWFREGITMLFSIRISSLSHVLVRILEVQQLVFPLSFSMLVQRVLFFHGQF